MKPEASNQRYYFDVFGTFMRVDRRDGQWRLFKVSADGKSSRIHDIFIPEDIHEGELITFLDDMFHEYSSPANDTVRMLRK